MPLVTLNYNTIVKIPSQQSPDSNNVLNSTPVTVSEKMPVESSPKYPTLEGMHYKYLQNLEYLLQLSLTQGHHMGTPC